MARFGTLAAIQGTVCRYDETNKEKVEDVEDADTPRDLVRSPRDLLLWINRFRSSQPSELGAGVGERRSDEDAAETLKAIEECGIRVVPVLKSSSA